MPSEKRQRQDEGRLQRLEAQRAEDAKGQRKRQARNIGIILGDHPRGRGRVRDLLGRRRRRRRGREHRQPPRPTSEADSTTTRRAAPRPWCSPAPAHRSRERRPARPPTARPSAPGLRAGPADLHRRGARPTPPRSRPRRATSSLELDAAEAPITVNNFVVLVPLPLLRRRALPPDRPRLRDPGRRPRRSDPATATRVQDRRRAAGRPGHGLLPGTVAMANSGPNTTAASSSS